MVTTKLKKIKKWFWDNEILLARVSDILRNTDAILLNIRKVSHEIYLEIFILLDKLISFELHDCFKVTVSRFSSVHSQRIVNPFIEDPWLSYHHLWRPQTIKSLKLRNKKASFKAKNFSRDLSKLIKASVNSATRSV